MAQDYQLIKITEPETRKTLEFKVIWKRTLCLSKAKTPKELAKEFSKKITIQYNRELFFNGAYTSDSQRNLSSSQNQVSLTKTELEEFYKTLKI